MDRDAMFYDCAAALELGLREARTGNPKMIDVFDAILFAKRAPAIRR